MRANFKLEKISLTKQKGRKFNWIELNYWIEFEMNGYFIEIFMIYPYDLIVNIKTKI